MAHSPILFFSNLYPVSWDPNRAAFNFQQTQCMEDKAAMTYLVPVPFVEWFRQRVLKRQKQKPSVTTFPFFYIPGTGRRFYPLMMFLSALICVVPLLKFCAAKRVIASWGFPDAVCAAWFKKLLGFSLIIQCHGSDINVHIANPARRKQMLSAFRLAQCVVTKSQAMANLILQYDPHIHAQAIYNGVDFNRFKVRPQPTHTTPLTLLFVGSIITTKGIFELIESISKLKREGLNIHLHIAGKGAEMDKLQMLVSDYVLGDHVVIHGSVAHQKIAELMASCHALILPSYREGVPNVMIESLACGMPALVTPVGGVPEILHDGKNGIILASHQVEDICHGITRFTQSSWDPQGIRGSIEHLNWENNVNQILEQY
ncbi:glycosyltransferase [Alteromonas sp. C1M14]|uniref:glycosyltransferase n=1 Tax=Alteromonas sp. C1M14 TaxID=2841567 RepID=UPI001C09F4A5|nr:glycosyltransferase [Alteromonas sp. C1M14]MBU2979205.1 glycosyltransferase [Alteromonas sp. C1M14]